MEIYGPGESESIAYLILSHIGFSRKSFYDPENKDLDEAGELFIADCVTQLLNYRPVQYILGETDFYGLRFILNEGVLIPRQETEELVQIILKENHSREPQILDLGTGSGCIAITLAKNLQGAHVTATDNSPDAIEIAVKNAVLNNAGVRFLHDDILDSKIDPVLKYDIIVSNPPYVLLSEKKLMHQNVLNFEPPRALFVTDDEPLVFYYAIARIASEKLTGNGKLYVEINEKFGPGVAEVLESMDFGNVHILKDIHGKDRFVRAEKIS